MPEDVKAQVLNALKDAGIAFEAVVDLCEMAARQDPKLKHWAGADAIRIVACFPRAVKWLFHTGRAPLLQNEVEILNMRTESAESIISSLLENQRPAGTPKNIQLEKRGDWIPWFPVIDYDRCQNCKQCLNFCLFGVYELSESDKVEVINPANCKTNCPACARVCPQTAIIFPKYSGSPINGDEVDEQAQQNEKTRVNLAELMSTDIHKTIRQRSKAGKRFSKDKDQQQHLAELGKFPALKELQEKLDIPAEVLASLSSGQMAQMKEKSKKKDCPHAQYCPSDCDIEESNSRD